MTRRILGKVSNYNPEDGLINLLARMMGVNPSEIKLSDKMLSQIKQIEAQKLEVKKIINPFYEDLKSHNSKENNKKISELIDLGKFIYYLEKEKEIEIIECSERPDFVIKYNGELIGIEHTGIYDQDIVAEIKTLRGLIERCQEKLNKTENALTGLFNIIIIPSKVKEKLPFNQEEIISKICECIVAKSKGTEFQKPEFVADIVLTNHSILELTLGEDYWLAELNNEAIATTISKKESKIDIYKTSKNLSKCWLLVVIDGASSASSFNIKLNSLPVHLTPFDKIFIFDTFKGQIICGKKSN